MAEGKYLYACEENIYFIKLIGNLSYITCAGFKSFTDKLLKENLAGVIYFDLTETKNIDSTNLGILAKCALHFLNKKNPKPVIYSTNKDVNLILSKNGFETIFNIITSDKIPSKDMDEVSQEEFPGKSGLGSALLDTHEILSKISESNRLKYRDVLQLLRFKKN